MEKEFDILQKSRLLMIKLIGNLTIEQLNKIPEGAHNNIAWNLAHLVVTQQLLCYRLSGLTCLVSEEMIAHFQKGTAPTYPLTAVAFEEIKKKFLEFPGLLKQDYARGVFQTYTEYNTSVGICLRNIEEAVRFNNYHEGIHLGVLLQLRKYV